MIDAWQVFTAAAVSVLTVAGIDLGIAFLARGASESGSERDD